MRFLKHFPKDNNGLYIVYDRFTFDNLFRLLLKNGFDHEEARDYILINCSLSALVFQERLYNNGYLRLFGNDALDPRDAAHRAKVISDFLEIAINAGKRRRRP
jgi:hypothetical protein